MTIPVFFLDRRRPGRVEKPIVLKTASQDRLWDAIRSPDGLPAPRKLTKARRKYGGTLGESRVASSSDAQAIDGSDDAARSRAALTIQPYGSRSLWAAYLADAAAEPD